MPRLTLSVCLLLSATLLLACGRPLPTLPPLGPDAVLLAFGDSLTYGTGAPAAGSYPAQLEARIGRTVINAGSPGEVTGEGLRRLPALLDRHEPDLLILCHGGNDLLRKRDRARTRANLQAMVEEAHRRGIPVLLLGVPQPALLSLQTAELYRELAQELALPLEAKVLPAVLADNALKSDQIHPNQAGYALVARAIEDLLRKSGAL